MTEARFSLNPQMRALVKRRRIKGWERSAIAREFEERGWAIPGTSSVREIITAQFSASFEKQKAIRRLRER